MVSVVVKERHQMSKENWKIYVSKEKVHPSVFIADTARVIGDVTIGKNSSVWYSALVRGDLESVIIGEDSNVQDGAIVHVDEGFPTAIGNGVSLGHGAIVHGATVEDNCLIAIGAILLNGVVVGANSIIGAGAVVAEGTHIPPNSLVLGVPGKVVRELTKEQQDRIKQTSLEYVATAAEYRQRLK